MKLRYFLALIFFILALAPVLLFRAWPHSAVLEREMDDVHEWHLLLAQNVSAALEQYHRDLSATFALLTDNTDLRQVETDGLRDAAMSNLHLRNICIVAPETGLVLDGLNRAQYPCPELFELEEPAIALQVGQASSRMIRFSSVTADKNGQNVMRMVSFLDDGRLAIGTIDTNYFRRIGESIFFGTEGRAIIVDAFGNVLSHPRADWVEQRKNLASLPSVFRMLQGETGVQVYYEIDSNSNLVAGFTSVPEIGWGVMIPQPISELKSKADMVRQSAMVVLLIGVGGSLVLAVILSYLLARPLEEVTNAARRVSKGELAMPSASLSTRLLPKEFGELLQGFRDMIDQLRENTVKINALAFVDSVTGLANREYFRRSVNAFIDYAGLDERAALLFLDLDGFKAVNDTKGHDIGDAVLKLLAERICLVLDVPNLSESYPDEASILSKRQNTQIARMGGDEFAVFLPDTNGENAVRIANSLLQAIEQPIGLDGSKIAVSASIGVSKFPEDAGDCSALLKAADVAMYQAKRSGKNQVNRYSASPTQEDRRQRLSDDLFSNDVGAQMDMMYQPVYRANGLSLASVECLIRWKHPDEGVLLPEDFFDAAAELGLMRQIDNMVLDRAAIIAEQVKQRGFLPLMFTMNLSIERLIDRPFIDRLVRLIPQNCPVSIELTESNLLDALDTRAAWMIDRLKEANIGVQLDDFGAAHASLSSLLDLAPDIIKLDGHLVSRVTNDHRIATLIGWIAGMAHDMGIEVVAKGVERVDQVDLLRDLGCDYVQGFALNIPLTRDELFVHLERDFAKETA